MFCLLTVVVVLDLGKVKLSFAITINKSNLLFGLIGYFGSLKSRQYIFLSFFLLLRCNLLFGLIGLFGLLKDVEISFFPLSFFVFMLYLLDLNMTILFKIDYLLQKEWVEMKHELDSKQVPLKIDNLFQKE